jgi:RNA polymerase sigma-70 factor (ECF subfamily)
MRYAHPVTDLDLLDAWRDGDAAAGQELVKRHYEAVYLFLYGKVDAQVSEDLTQATFETLCRKRDEFRGDSALRTFVLGIARWKLVQHFERKHAARRRFQPLEHSVQDPALDRSIHSLFAARDREMLVVQALRGLPLDDQLILELKDYEGLTAAQLARVFEIPPGTVASRLRRARQRLREGVQRLAHRPDLVEQTLTSLDGCMRAIRERVAGSLT